MGTTADALGIGPTFEHEGRVFRLSQMTFAMQGQYERWFEEKSLRDVLRLRRHMSSEDHRRMLADLRKDINAGEYDFGREVVSSSLLSVDGMRHFLWLLLTPSHPGIDEQEVDAMIRNEETMLGVQSAMERLFPKAKTAKTTNES